MQKIYYENYNNKVNIRKNKKISTKNYDPPYSFALRKFLT
jgi:hypothetical protein